MAKKCPNNTLCFNKTNVLILLGIIIGGLFVACKTMKTPTISMESFGTNNYPFITKRTSEPSVHNQSVHPLYFKRFGPSSSSTFYDVYQPPLKPSWNAQLEAIKNVTPSYTDSLNYDFKQVGILTRNEEHKERETILALFGRPIHHGRSKWQYYTITDKNKSIKLPIKHKGRSCSVKTGCDEIYSDDNVFVGGFKEQFTVTIYETDTIM